MHSSNSAWATRSLARLRFLGYAGAQLNGLLVPLLVFRLSGSAALAGGALLLEWLPKLGFYWIGGSFATRFGEARTHAGLDAARLFAMLTLLWCALGHGSLGWVAASAALYQCANALSNILFEGSVTRWWEADQRARGHAALMRSDQWGCMLVLALGLCAPPLWALASLGVAMQLVASLWVGRVAPELYPHGALRAPGTEAAFLPRLRADARAMRCGPLLRLAGASTLLSVAPALFFSALAFFMNRSQAGSASDPIWFSALLLCRAGFAVGVLELARSRLSQGRERERMGRLGAFVLVGSALAMSFPLPLWGLALTAGAMGVSGALYLPLMRELRQTLIHAHIPEASRPGVTGMLISAEASSFLIAGALMMSAGEHLQGLALAVAVMATLGILSLRSLRRALLPAEG